MPAHIAHVFVKFTLPLHLCPYLKGKESMHNRRLSCLPWWPKQGRQVLLASILSLLVFGLSAFSFAPSARSASASAHAATVPQVPGNGNCSTAPRNSPWRSWSCDEVDQPCFNTSFLSDCPGLNIHLHADGVYNPVTQKVWLWNISCQPSDQQAVQCTWLENPSPGNGTSALQVGANGRIYDFLPNETVNVGIRITMKANGTATDYQFCTGPCG